MACVGACPGSAIAIERACAAATPLLHIDRRVSDIVRDRRVVALLLSALRQHRATLAERGGCVNILVPSG